VKKTLVFLLLKTVIPLFLSFHCAWQWTSS